MEKPEPEVDKPKQPETLKLFRKKYPPWLLALGALGVLLALAFMIYMIWSAMQPPNLHYQP
ncbi:MAG: hypothetical protein HY293_22730 [Planctomycetes bacterium]|nr:hypothetical protein [Planctomycetota bacterium]